MLIIFDLDDTLYSCTDSFPNGIDHEAVNSILVFEGVKEFLTNFSGKKVLLSKGDQSWQDKKIDVLGIRGFFDEIIICSTTEQKKECLKTIMEKYNDSHTWVVGDRIDSEIRYANQLGLKTVLLKQGKYKNLAPQTKHDHPDFTIEAFAQLQNVTNRQ